MMIEGAGLRRRGGSLLGRPGGPYAETEPLVRLVGRHGVLPEFVEKRLPPTSRAAEAAPTRATSDSGEPQPPHSGTLVASSQDSALSDSAGHTYEPVHPVVAVLILRVHLTALLVALVGRDTAASARGRSPTIWAPSWKQEQEPSHQAKDAKSWRCWMLGGSPYAISLPKAKPPSHSGGRGHVKTHS